MDEPTVADRRRFGQYLRVVREDRKLSLDAVEELTGGYPDPVTKSHLSRIENGAAVPSFGKMFALSHVYGVPIAALAERFEIELLRQVAAPHTVPDTPRDVLARIERLRLEGDYSAGIPFLAAAIERFGAEPGGESKLVVDLRIHEISFLIHLERYELAKVRCEQLLGRAGIDAEQRVLTMLNFANCCYRLRRFTIAEMALDQIEKELDSGAFEPRIKAFHRSVRGRIEASMGLHERAVTTYESAIELHMGSRNTFEAVIARLNLADSLIQLGRLDEATPHARSAVQVAEDSGYDRLKALGLSHLALISYRKGDLGAAESFALRSNVIARSREFVSVVFRNCYYLREIARRRDDTVAATQNQRTLRAYLTRVDADLPEAAIVRAELAGGDP
jgi:transcriptional regulator with XRE-family HTH domain